jgi:P4 family phage/plasmid primase-like protien
VNSSTVTQNTQSLHFPQLNPKSLAVKLHEMGANVLAIRPGEKRPYGEWELWQSTRQTDHDLNRLPWRQAGAVGIVNGYDGWRSVDFDANKDGSEVPFSVVESFLTALQLPRGYQWIERSGSGLGYHVWFKCKGEFPSELFENEDEKAVYIGVPPDKAFKQVEIRWADSQTVVAASANPELWLYGPPLEAPRTVAAEAVVSAFLTVAEPKFRESPTREPLGKADKSDLPGTDYNQRGDVIGVLTKHHWKHLGDRLVNGRTVSDWQRSGSNGNHLHATFNHFPGLFYVFSTNAEPFTANETYTPFAVYTLLEHGGDFEKAAAQLRFEGYGPKPNPVLKNGGQTQVDYAKRLTALFGDSIRYVTEFNRWAIYDGKRFELAKSVDSVPIEGLTKEMLSQTYAASFLLSDTVAANIPANNRNNATPISIREQFQKEHSKVKNIYAIRGIIQLARSEDRIEVHADRLNKDPFALNLENGTLDLLTMELRDHSPDDLITKVANTRFDPHANCPLWLAFLKTITEGDTEMIAYLQRFAGYALTGTSREQMVAIFFGEGGNGKTTFLETIGTLLGDYYLKTPTKTLLQMRDKGIGDDLIRLDGARLVTANELPDSGRLDTAMIKDMTGNDLLVGRKLYGEHYQFRPGFTLAIYGNKKPELPADDEGIWRRVHLITFGYQVPEGERDKRLQEKLAEELPGILNWALEGFKVWSQEGLNPPTKVIAETEEFRDEMNQPQRFYEECFELDSSSEIEMSKVLAVYEEWYRLNKGGRKLNTLSMGHLLTKLKHEKRKSNGIVLRSGLKLSKRGEKLLAESRAFVWKDVTKSDDNAATDPDST